MTLMAWQLLFDHSDNDLRNRSACHETAGLRCPVGAPAAFAPASAATPFPLPWTQAFGLPQRSYWHPIRPQDGHRLGRPAGGSWLWLRQNLPSLLAGLAPGGCLAPTARPAVGRT